MSLSAPVGHRPAGGAARAGTSVETARSWAIATAVTAITTFSFGAPMVTPVALKEIAAELGSPRSVPALAASVVWIGSGSGAIVYGWLAERVGSRLITAGGAVALGTGLVLAATGGAVQLVLAHLLLVGLLGSGAINIPLVVYTSRWFDRRRGSALALVSSGQYIAGALWPMLITVGLQRVGWRVTMAATGVITALAIVPLALLSLAPPPRDVSAVPVGAAQATTRAGQSVFALLCIAGFLCCAPMAMPPAHLVALCGDLGIAATHGALMLSVLLACAFLSRQFWGLMSDRVGGLPTILAASACQAVALFGFVVTQDELGLFAVAAAFGLGFSGIIPSYVLVLREIFPAGEASWRVPVWYLANLCGMAFGGWVAGLIYDRSASYAPAFLLGVALNLGNLAVIGGLLAQKSRSA